MHITVEKAEAALARKCSTKTNTTSGTAAAVRVCMYTSEADFHKPGIYGGSVRVWAAAWDVLRRVPSRVGRGGRASVDFVVRYGLGGFYGGFFVFNEASPRERSDRGRFLLLGKNASSYGVRTGCHYLTSLSVCVYV